MKKTLLISLLALGLSAAYGAASAVPDVPLYDGKTLTQDNLTAGNWGGGSVEDSTELFLFGGHSLKVTTLDPYQGAKISFLTPVPLTGSGRVFQVTVQRGGVTLHYVPQGVPNAGQNGPQNGAAADGGGGAAAAVRVAADLGETHLALVAPVPVVSVRAVHLALAVRLAPVDHSRTSPVTVGGAGGAGGAGLRSH